MAKNMTIFISVMQRKLASPHRNSHQFLMKFIVFDEFIDFWWKTLEIVIFIFIDFRWIWNSSWISRPIEIVIFIDEFIDFFIEKFTPIRTDAFHQKFMNFKSDLILKNHISITIGPLLMKFSELIANESYFYIKKLFLIFDCFNFILMFMKCPHF
jgi:hypothetical protein